MTAAPTSRCTQSAHLHSTPIVCKSAGSSKQGSTETIKVSPKTQHEIITKQRLNRPVAPHLGVYDIEQTWFGSSAWMRITGITLSGAAYVFFTSYLVAPMFGMEFDTSDVVAAFRALPPFVQDSIRFIMAFPFTFHFFNGLKQLTYDVNTGAVYSKSTIKKADYYLWAVTVLVSSWVAFGLS